jgi:GH25 family lysozyme M1 (1,4-beta-N-acetylmuramidase)
MKMRIPGTISIIDVSSCQAWIDFVGLAKWVGPDGDKVEAVISKATEGNTDHPDPRFPGNWKDTASVGLPRGAYHFAHPDTIHVKDAEDEAERFVKQLEIAGGFGGDLDFAALDIEEASRIPRGDLFAKWVADFADRVDALTGKVCGIYVGGPFWHDHANPPPSKELLARLQRHWLWLAAYVVSPDKFVAAPWAGAGWTIWQESGDIAPAGQSVLRIPAVGGGKVNIDRDLYRGTPAQFRAWVTSLKIAPSSKPQFDPFSAKYSLQLGRQAELASEALDYEDLAPTTPQTPASKSDPRFAAVNTSPPEKKT